MSAFGGIIWFIRLINFNVEGSQIYKRLLCSSYNFADILKVDFFCAVKTLVFIFLHKKKCKNITKNHIICLKHEEKNCKGG